MNLEGSSIEVSDPVSYFAAPDTCPVARRLTSRITPPSPQLRGFVRTLPNTVPAHRHAWSLFDMFDAIEIGGDSDQQSLGSSGLRIGFWNAERCKHLDDSVDMIRSADLDVLLLAEMDRGMARSGGWHTARALAERLGWFYVWGVEFVELGLGDSRERNWHHGGKNAEGLHGNAILSRIPLRDPALIRLDDAPGSPKRPTGSAVSAAAWGSAPASKSPARKSPSSRFISKAGRLRNIGPGRPPPPAGHRHHLRRHSGRRRR